MIFSYIFLAFLFSSPLWMQSSVDPLAWGLLQICTFIYAGFLICKKRTIILPQILVTSLWVFFLLFSTFLLFFSSNFYTGFQSLLKLFWISAIGILFIQNPNWKRPIEHCILFFAFLAATNIWLQLLSWIHPNLIGSFLAAGAIIALNKTLNKKFYLALVIFLSISLIKNMSLAPILAWFTGSLFWILKQSNRKKYLQIFAIVLIFFALIPQTHLLVNRKITDPYTKERIQLWQESFSLFKDHIWLGSGLGSYRNFYPQYKQKDDLRLAPYAHNEALNILCETGLLGILILGLITFFILKNFPKADAQSGAVLIALLFQSLFDFNLRYPAILAILIFYLVPLLQNQELKKSSWITVIFCVFLSIVSFFPTLANVIYRTQPQHLNLCIKLDPLNSFYRLKTQRASQFLIAIRFDPRNVWARKALGDFYYDQWKKSADITLLNQAIIQYTIITHLAPSISIFKEQKEFLLSLLQ